MKFRKEISESIVSLIDNLTKLLVESHILETYLVCYSGHSKGSFHFPEKLRQILFPIPEVDGYTEGKDFIGYYLFVTLSRSSSRQSLNGLKGVSWRFSDERSDGRSECLR